MSGGVYSLEQTTAYDFETLAVTNGAALALTLAKYKPGTSGLGIMGATRIFCTVETASARYRYDGTAPTTAVGHLLNAGDTLTIEGEGNIANLKFIATTGTNSSISVTYESG